MGYLRLTLSLIIMASHLVYVGNAWSNTGLICFYILSGYSITASGIKPGFWRRRFWRLWPSYAAIAVITQISLFLGWAPGRPLVGIARGWDALAQAAMVAPAWPTQSLIPTAWMLKWLLLGYFVMWCGASRTPQRSAVWLLLTAIASMFWYSRTPAFGQYYQGPLLALLTTAIGACCWHLGLVAPRDGRWAAWAGALSYPLFLAHYPVGAAIAGARGWDVGWPLFWASLGPTLAASWLLVVAVERPIARYRRSLRNP